LDSCAAASPSFGCCAEQAREVIGQLVNESNLSIEQSVVDNLVEAATVEGEVSPVDIGIGLLVLAELHERQSCKTIGSLGTRVVSSISSGL
jgi:hypothetical protein